MNDLIHLQIEHHVNRLSILHRNMLAAADALSEESKFGAAYTLGVKAERVQNAIVALTEARKI